MPGNQVISSPLIPYSSGPYINIAAEAPQCQLEGHSSTLTSSNSSIALCTAGCGRGTGSRYGFRGYKQCWKSVGNLGATTREVNTKTASPLKLKGRQNQTQLKKKKKKKLGLKQKESEFLYLQKVGIACRVKTKHSPAARQGKTFHPGT